jgi:hypothetical protein
MIRLAVPISSGTFPWTTATSTGAPSGVETGTTAGRNASPRATAAGTTPRRHSPPRSRASVARALMAATRNPRPTAPITEAAGSMMGLSCWVAPRLTQLQPPNGHTPRSHSTSPQAAPTATAVRTGAPSRHTTGTSPPKTARNAPTPRTSAAHPSTVTGISQDRSNP